MKSKTMQFIWCTDPSNTSYIEEMSEMSLNDICSDHNVTMQPFPGGEEVKLLGTTKSILSFLTYINSLTMGQGEGPSDWKPLITPAQ